MDQFSTKFLVHFLFGVCLIGGLSGAHKSARACEEEHAREKNGTQSLAASSPNKTLARQDSGKKSKLCPYCSKHKKHGNCNHGDKRTQ